MNRDKVSESAAKLEYWLRRAWIFDRLDCPTLASICRELAADCAREGWAAVRGSL